MKTITVEASQLSGAALDWAVAQVDPQCEGLEWVCVEAGAIGVSAVGYAEIDGRKEPCAYLAHGCMLRRKIQMRKDDVMPYAPTTDWSQGGPLIEKLEGLTQGDAGNWYAIPTGECEVIELPGPTPLIAICRAIVAAELGDDVEVPAELVEVSNA